MTSESQSFSSRSRKQTRRSWPAFVHLMWAGIVLGIAYLGYELIDRPRTSPCEQISETTAVSLESQLEVVKAKGNVFIGRKQLQQLSDQTQEIGVILETCCLLVDRGKISSGEFLQCRSFAYDYASEIEKLATLVTEAHIAKDQNHTDLVNEKVKEINESLKTTQSKSQEFHEQAHKIPQPQEGIRSQTIYERGFVRFQNHDSLPNTVFSLRGRMIVTIYEAFAKIEVKEANNVNAVWYVPASRITYIGNSEIR